MTDRVQPGAIDSLIRNDELSQIFNQFSEGWIIESGTTPAARRRSNIDETALNSFALQSTSGRDATIAPGEAFIGGWCARDTSTTLTVPSSTTATVVAGWDLDVAFSGSGNRDDADETIVQLERNTDPDYPVTPIFEVTTDSSSITSTTDVRNLGPTAVVELLDAISVTADSVDATDVISNTLDATTGSIDELDVATTLTDAAGIAHSDELADVSDGVTEFQPGAVADGEFLRNENGSLTGASRARNVSAKGVLTAQQTIVPDTLTQINIDSVAFEEDAAVIEVDTAGDRLRIKQTGIYELTANYAYVDRIGDEYQFDIRKNGTDLLAQTRLDPAGGFLDPSASNTAVVDVQSPPAEITYETVQGGTGDKDLATTPTSLAVTRQR
jgi:hypothetical protein